MCLVMTNSVFGFANHKCADQAAHPRSLISAYVIHRMERFTSKLATSKIAIFYIVSVADKAGLGPAWS